MRVITYLLCLFFFEITYAAQEIKSEAKWSDLPEFQCDRSEIECYKQAESTLKTSFMAFDTRRDKTYNYEMNPHFFPDDQGVGRYILQGRKTSVVFVILHGLYGSDEQFRSFAFHLSHEKQNVLSLVLPGHGQDWKRAVDVTADDWEAYVQRATKLASFLGERVILVGQSTGGLLAYEQAAFQPETVQGLILIEPAFRVNSGSAAAACVGKVFVNYASESPTLAALFGVDTKYLPKSVSPKMGCEVVRMRERLLKKFALPLEQANRHGYKDAPDEAGDRSENDKSLAAKIHIPTLVMNIADDEVVNSTDIKVFATELEKNRLGSYYEHAPGTTMHGYFNKQDPSLFYSIIDKFLDEKMNYTEVRAQAAKLEAINQAQIQTRIILEAALKAEIQIREYEKSKSYGTRDIFVDFYIASIVNDAQSTYRFIDLYSALKLDLNSIEKVVLTSSSLVPDSQKNAVGKYVALIQAMFSKSKLGNKWPTYLKGITSADRAEIENLIAELNRK